MALLSPWALRVRSPLSPIDVGAVYTPGPRFCPARSAKTAPVEGCVAAVLKAVVSSV